STNIHVDVLFKGRRAQQAVPLSPDSGNAGLYSATPKPRQAIFPLFTAWLTRPRRRFASAASVNANRPKVPGSGTIVTNGVTSTNVSPQRTSSKAPGR